MKWLLIATFLLLVIAGFVVAQKKSDQADQQTMSEQEFNDAVRKANERQRAGFAKPQVLYYAAVINPSGQTIAYVKRTVDYSVEGEGPAPFLDAPAVKVKSDLIELCQQNIATGEEAVLHSWPLPLVKMDSLGNVHPTLNWQTENLRYSIRLAFFGDINIGEKRDGPSGTEFYLTNVSPDLELVQEPHRAGETLIKLSENPEKIRFPTSNKIIIDRSARN